MEDEQKVADTMKSNIPWAPRWLLSEEQSTRIYIVMLEVKDDGHEGLFTVEKKTKDFMI